MSPNIRAYSQLFGASNWFIGAEISPPFNQDGDEVVKGKRGWSTATEVWETLFPVESSFLAYPATGTGELFIVGRQKDTGIIRNDRKEYFSIVFRGLRV